MDGCVKMQSSSMRMCAMHYWRMRTYGTTDAPPGRVYPTKAGCAVEGCGSPSFGRGWCSVHYLRWYRHGDPLFTKTLAGEPAEVRFWQFVNKTDTCWLWTGFCDKNGYGRFKDGDVGHRAHRWSYEHFVGPIPEGLQIDHLCRVTGCVRPDHLEAVPAKENVRRTMPFRERKTHCIHGHEYTAENTLYERLPGGTLGRRCRTCRQAGDRARWPERSKRRRSH